VGYCDVPFSQGLVDVTVEQCQTQLTAHATVIISGRNRSLVKLDGSADTGDGDRAHQHSLSEPSVAPAQTGSRPALPHIWGVRQSRDDPTVPDLRADRIGCGHRELMLVAEGIGCRLSEHEDQFHEVGWRQVGAQRQRGISRVIEEHAEGAPPVPGLVGRGLSGRWPGGCVEMVLNVWAGSAEPRRGSPAQQGSGWCTRRR
jgi:hypothetical protein